MKEYTICTPFTGVHTPAIKNAAFWNLLHKDMTLAANGVSLPPMFDNDQSRVLFRLQELGMPRNNNCNWIVGTTPASEEFLKVVTSYEGCERILQPYKEWKEDPELYALDGDPSLVPVFEYADKIGYSIRGPWIFLLGPRPRTLVPAVECLKYEDAWFIFTKDDCRSKKLWAECCSQLKKSRRKGVAWKGKQVVELDAAGIKIMESWNV